jgi:acyl-CoA thioester hydrolase
VHPFAHRQRVRYHETDAQHHVFNSRYLEYIDIAFTEFLRELGWAYLDLVKDGCDPSLVHVELDFLAPVRFDEELVVAVYVHKVGTTSFTIRYEGSVNDRAVLTGSVVYVNYDVATGRSRALPARFSQRLTDEIG